MRKFKHLALFPLFIFWSCGGPSDNEPPGAGQFGGGENRGTAVEVSEIEPETITDQIRSYGSIRARDEIKVVPQLGEQITDIYVDLGDNVEEGELLARLYDTTYRDDVRSDRATLQQRRVALERDSMAYQRQQQLHERGAISTSEYEEAHSAYQSSIADYEAAEAALTQSRENLKKTEVRAPVDGVITQRYQARGDLASTGQELFDISTSEGQEIRLHLPRREWARTQINQEVHLRASGEQHIDAQGIVTRRSPEINRNTGLGEVVVTLTESGGSIHSGVLAEARVNVDRRDQAVVVPRSALLEQVQTRINPETNNIEIEREYSAFVAVGDTIAERRQVQPGIEQGNRLEITEGLQPGEKLIVTGQRGLQDESRIRIAEGDPLEEAEPRTVEDDEAAPHPETDEDAD